METIPTPMFYNYLTMESGSSSNPTFETNLQCRYNYHLSMLTSSMLMDWRFL